MNRRAKYFVGLVIVALALLSPHFLQAQSTFTLDGLATQVKALTDRLNDAERTDRRLGAKIAALENRIAQLEPTPTRTPRPRPTRRPTPKPTATSRPCNMSGIPEPPIGSLDCETWKVTYGLISLEVGYVPSSMHHRLAREIYPLIEKAADNCSVSPIRLADYIVVASRELEKLGKPSNMPDQAITYLIGATSADSFKGIVQSAGGCAEAISLTVVLAK